MTLAPLHPRPGMLRAAAEEIERATGLRVEIIGGTLMMSTTPRGKHAGVVYMVAEAIRPRLPEHLVAIEVSSVEMPDDPDDYSTPGLTVAPAAFLRSDDWLLEPADVELALEVISMSEKARSITDKIEWYAVAGLRLLLVIDPRDGSWALHSHPRDREYQGVLHGKYGESVPLPSPFDLFIETGALPTYGDR